VWRLWRSKGGIVEAAEIGAIGLAGLRIPMFQLHHADGSNDAFFGTLAIGLAAAVGACAGFGWNKAERREDARFALLAIVGGVLLAGSALLLLSTWQAGLAIALLGLGLLHLSQVAEDKRFEPAAWIFAVAGILVYPWPIDGPGLAPRLDAVRWTGQAAIMAAFAWRARFGIGRIVAQFQTPLFLYIGAAAVVPELYRPLIAPVLLVAVAAFARRLDQRLIPAMASCLAIIVAWALSPFGMWLSAGLESLFGTPVLVTSVPQVGDAVRQLLVPGAALVAAAIIAPRLGRLVRTACLSIAGVLGVVGLHSLYKHVFAIAAPPPFVTLGLAERTVWEFALAAGAFAAFRLRRPLLALAFAIAAAAHLTVYTLLIHNPLWAVQAVGPWPVANLLLPAYALAIGLAVAGKRAVQPVSGEVALGLNIVTMALVVLFAFSELRQLFHDTLLNGHGLPVAEDISRSILAIVLAIGFLLWGIRSQQRAWRIASLALMLGAVGKVFLFDASGLQGVTRIASFVALGFSLIGIGWLYSRHLGSDKVAAEPA
jgi:uncharacterized membrane protein